MISRVSKPILSIIVPVYNAVRYLENTLQCILDQSYTNFELILIDDGSTDSSGNICDKTALRDSRVIVCHQTNKGMSAARNKGLDIVRGDYIAFIDSDDLLESDYLEAMMEKIADVDFVVVGFDRVGDLAHDVFPALDHCATFNRSEAMRLFLTDNTIHGSVWGKVYKKSVLKNIRFDESLKLLEDQVFSFEVLCNTDKCTAIPGARYHYVQHHDSLIHFVPDRRSYESRLQAQEFILEQAGKRNLGAEIVLLARERYWREIVSCLKMALSLEQKDNYYFCLKKLVREKIVFKYLKCFLPWRMLLARQAKKKRR